MASAVCAGLAHAHEHGVVHRDVKPANVLLGRDGSVRVLDFGIASLDEPDATVDDRMLGTLSYMAPETCQGARPTPATDVWAVGVMVYEALTGANPFRARTPDELRERHRHPPRSLGDLRPDLPRALAAACARALESHPRRRPSAAAFARVLSAAADAHRAARPARAAHGRRRWGRRRAAAAAARRLQLCPSLPASALPRLPGLPALQRPDIDVDVGGWVAAISRCGLGAPSEAVVRAVRLAAGSACAGIAIAAVLGAFPFWPSGLVLPLACAGAALALASPWLAAAFALAVCVPAVGDVSAGLAWCVALAGGAVAAGLRARGPARAPACRSRRCSPRSSCGRSTCSPPAVCAALAGRALAGAAGPFAIALWAAVPLAGGLAGSADAGAVGAARDRRWARRCSCRARPGRLRPPRCRMSWPRRGGDCSWASGWPGCWQGRSRCLPWRVRHPSRRVARSRQSGPWLYCWRWACVRPMTTRRPGSRYRRRSKLGILRSIESRLERVVEGSVGRLFRASVAPVELARKLAKELEEGKVVSVTQTYAPNEYTIYLSPRDRTRFAEFEASLRNELASYLAEHARRAGYVMPTRPRVRFETESSLHTGIFGISTALVRDDDAPSSRSRRRRRRRAGGRGALPRPQPPAPEPTSAPCPSRLPRSPCARRSTPTPPSGAARASRASRSSPSPSPSRSRVVRPSAAGRCPTSPALPDGRSRRRAAGVPLLRRAAAPAPPSRRAVPDRRRSRRSRHPAAARRPGHDPDVPPRPPVADEPRRR